jgi:hypothetical protein
LHAEISGESTGQQAAEAVGRTQGGAQAARQEQAKQCQQANGAEQASLFGDGCKYKI